MTGKRRNVGREILDGIQELKRGERGRVFNVAADSAMKSDKRRRLERAGWTVGDAADFLELSRNERDAKRPRMKRATRKDRQ